MHIWEIEFHELCNFKIISIVILHKIDLYIKIHTNKTKIVAARLMSERHRMTDRMADVTLFFVDSYSQRQKKRAKKCQFDPKTLPKTRQYSPKSVEKKNRLHNFICLRKTIYSHSQSSPVCPLF